VPRIAPIPAACRTRRGEVPRLLLLLPALAVLAACEREARRFRESPPAATAEVAVTINPDVQPGVRIIDPTIVNPYEHNAWAVSEGKQLFDQWNCSGCHAARGGGGMGPALSDSIWEYGSEPENIFSTIVEGRPEGMPSFRNRMGNTDVWKLVAYVRTLGALTPADVRTGREEGLRRTTPTPQEEPRKPMRSLIPPESKAP
jgi:cytochrome c oxidase cbb3-type subunit 3